MFNTLMRAILFHSNRCEEKTPAKEKAPTEHHDIEGDGDRAFHVPVGIYKLFFYD